MNAPRDRNATRDRHIIALFLRLLRPWLRYYYRIEVYGLEDRGRVPTLFVANHNAGAVIEVFGLLEAWENAREPRKPSYGLAHRFGLAIPGVNLWLRKLGAVPATHEAARGVLRDGNCLFIFPGGDRETTRPIWQRTNCDFAGRMGWAKIALEEKVPIVPIAIRGSHETNPMLFRSQLLARILLLPYLLGIRWFPISVAQILLTVSAYFLLRDSLPALLVAIICYVIFLFAALVPLFPSKIRIDFLETVPPTETDPAALYAEVTSRISKVLALPRNSAINASRTRTSR
jgi:1-acyl-sn-glycerol-3-phosphate acyltransferase